MNQSLILSNRSCGTCTLCCKVMSIAELDKPQGQWCTHCEIGKSCSIYEQRPSECATFHCGYLTWPMAGEEWFPASSKMVIVSELNGARVAVHVDPGRPAAWKSEPFYSQIKEWACHAASNMLQVVVCIGSRAIVILPDEDVDLGHIADDERIITAEVRQNGRFRLQALKLKANDPRIAGLQTGVPFERTWKDVDRDGKIF